jgi:uncharacterized protein
MKLNLKTLKLHPGENQSFYLEVPGNNVLLEDLGSFAECIKVDLTIHNNGSDYQARGKLYTSLQLICSRCLEGFIYNIETEIAFSIQDERQVQESNLSEDVLIVNQDEVDIQPLVYEIILTEIPLIALCKEECCGLCPVCGQNLNQDKCSCQEEIIDPRWEKLKNYT